MAPDSLSLHLVCYGGLKATGGTMDKVKAETWEHDLRGKEVGGCTIEALIDFGKSAAVFKAVRAGQTVALKIFDDELIERYGDKTQLARIDRELTLIGRAHPNMVEILDGGFDPATGNHFIVMAYLPGPSLQKCLAAVPEANIPLLIEQLASCCAYLETLSLAHRDIKPANIVILDDHTRLVLLDFGVLKPVGEVGVTDDDGIQSFVGTLQYSSPEFLLRTEQDTIEGWRALSLYQIGGVLHDLIMRRPLFQDLENPYARLVMAVQYDQPSVISTTVPSYLVEACKAALVKDPETRVALVGWESFSPPVKTSTGAAARERVTRRSIVSQVAAVPEPAPASSGLDLVDAVIDLVKVEARRVRSANTAAFPPFIITRTPGGDGVTVMFRPAAQQSLPIGLTLALTVSVLDQSAQAVIVHVGAWLGGVDVQPAELATIEGYRGILATPAISTLLETAMYLAVDQAQSHGNAAGPKALNLSELEAS